MKTNVVIGLKPLFKEYKKIKFEIRLKQACISALLKLTIDFSIISKIIQQISQKDFSFHSNEIKKMIIIQF